MTGIKLQQEKKLWTEEKTVSKNGSYSYRGNSHNFYGISSALSILYFVSFFSSSFFFLFSLQPCV